MPPKTSSAAPYPETDRILIIGGGIAGSLLALVLGRRGLPVTVFDPRRNPPASFRNEKLGEEQAAVLEELGALECFARVCLPPQGHPHAYAENPRLTDCGAPHHEWVASVRANWPENVHFVEAMVEAIETSDDRQTVITKTGERFEGRLAVLASGRMTSLREHLGIATRTLSEGHSATLGFTVESRQPILSQVFNCPPGSGVGYVSLFPMPGPAGAHATRINIFSFRPLSHDWTRRMSRDPLGGLAEISPEAADALKDARLTGRCEVRGTDIYAMRNFKKPGLIVIGDAFQTTCPASGTGMLRVLYDVRQLSQVHLPQWLATPGMERAKTDRFYADPLKSWLDRNSLKRSFNGRKNALRHGLFATALPHLRRWRDRLHSLLGIRPPAERLAVMSRRAGGTLKAH